MSLDVGFVPGGDIVSFGDSSDAPSPKRFRKFWKEQISARLAAGMSVTFRCEGVSDVEVASVGGDTHRTFRVVDTADGDAAGRRGDGRP